MPEKMKVYFSDGVVLVKTPAGEAKYFEFDEDSHDGHELEPLTESDVSPGARDYFEGLP